MEAARPARLGEARPGVKEQNRFQAAMKAAGAGIAWRPAAVRWRREWSQRDHCHP